MPCFIKKKNGCTVTTLCNKVRVKDNSKSKRSLLMREIEKFGIFSKHLHQKVAHLRMGGLCARQKQIYSVRRIP